MNNIVELFLNASKSYPNNTAIIEEEEIDYKTLAHQVKQTAAIFEKEGVQKGDRVLILIPMSIHLYRTVLAVFYIGAVAVFLDEWINKSRMELCCKIANCKAFVAGRKIRLLSVFSKELRKIPIKLNVALHKKLSIKETAQTMLPAETALLTFTTGSTGTPKAANRTHGFLKEQFDALLKEINPKPSDIDLPVLPIVLLCNLAVGATSLIASFNKKKPEKMNVQRVVDKLLKNKVNRITASPFFFDQITTELNKNGQTLSGIQKIFTGGAPVFPEQVENYAQVFDKASIKIAYGSTEAEPISVIDGEELVRQKQAILKEGLCVGYINSAIQLKIIRITDEPIISSDDQLREIELENGCIGEIVVAGKHVLSDYFNNEKALKRNKIFTNNKIWHRTGDAGRILNGKLYLVGACTQLIKKQNEYLSPFVYAYFIKKHAGLAFGTVLLFRGEITLVVEGDEILINKKAANLLEYDALIYVKKIPRDPRHHSKIDYPLLVQKLEKIKGTLPK